MTERLYAIEVTIVTMASGRTAAEAESRVCEAQKKQGNVVVEFGDTRDVLENGVWKRDEQE